MPALKLAVTAFGVAVTLSRHPLVRAGMLAAAPHVLTPANKARAAVLARDAAYAAGVVARRVLPRNLVR